jgi:hypothetical protein
MLLSKQFLRTNFTKRHKSRDLTKLEHRNTYSFLGLLEDLYIFVERTQNAILKDFINNKHLLEAYANNDSGFLPDIEIALPRAKVFKHDYVFEGLYFLNFLSFHIVLKPVNVLPNHFENKEIFFDDPDFSILELTKLQIEPNRAKKYKVGKYNLLVHVPVFLTDGSETLEGSIASKYFSSPHAEGLGKMLELSLVKIKTSGVLFDALFCSILEKIFVEETSDASCDEILKKHFGEDFSEKIEQSFASVFHQPLVSSGNSQKNSSEDMLSILFRHVSAKHSDFDSYKSKLFNSFKNLVCMSVSRSGSIHSFFSEIRVKFESLVNNKAVGSSFTLSHSDLEVYKLLITPYINRIPKYVGSGSALGFFVLDGLIGSKNNDIFFRDFRELVFLGDLGSFKSKIDLSLIDLILVDRLTETLKGLLGQSLVKPETYFDVNLISEFVLPKDFVLDATGTHIKLLGRLMLLNVSIERSCRTLSYLFPVEYCQKPNYVDMRRLHSVQNLYSLGHSLTRISSNILQKDIARLEVDINTVFFDVSQGRGSAFFYLDDLFNRLEPIIRQPLDLNKDKRDLFYKVWFKYSNNLILKILDPVTTSIELPLAYCCLVLLSGLLLEKQKEILDDFISYFNVLSVGDWESFEQYSSRLLYAQTSFLIGDESSDEESIYDVSMSK